MLGDAHTGAGTLRKSKEVKTAGAESGQSRRRSGGEVMARRGRVGRFWGPDGWLKECLFYTDILHLSVCVLYLTIKKC